MLTLVARLMVIGPHFLSLFGLPFSTFPFYFFHNHLFHSFLRRDISLRPTNFLFRLSPSPNISEITSTNKPTSSSRFLPTRSPSYFSTSIFILRRHVLRPIPASTVTPLFLWFIFLYDGHEVFLPSRFSSFCTPHRFICLVSFLFCLRTTLGS